jgi:1-acyl-sn-glycerol-3-phosphate acyltransferase
MPVPPALAGYLASRMLRPETYEHVRDLRFADAGHGYDPFGLHPAFVAMGLGITRFFYERYFRVISSGAEHIPDSGAAILAANHSGTIPVDGMMLWTDVVRQSTPPRVPRAVADYFVPMLPVIGTLFARNGVVAGSRGNVRQLLEAGNLMMIFPEGVPGIGKNFRDRYKLRPFRVGHAELAIRHRVPVIPVGIIGPEEQMPQIARIEGVNLFGVPYIPITLTPLPLPVRYHIHYGEPIPLHRDYRRNQADDPEVVAEAAARVQAACQALIDQGLRQRKGVFR